MNNKQRQKQAIESWVQGNLQQLDLSITLHFSNAVRARLQAWDHISHGRLLRCYFNSIDRCIYKAAHRNRGQRVQRVVLLGHQTSVGWHAHALISTPEGFGQERFAILLKEKWLQLADRFARHRNKRFDKQLFDCKPTHSGSESYIRSHNTDFAGQSADLAGEIKQGLFDYENTHISSATNTCRT